MVIGAFFVGIAVFLGPVIDVSTFVIGPIIAYRLRE